MSTNFLEFSAGQSKDLHFAIATFDPKLSMIPSYGKIDFDADYSLHLSHALSTNDGTTLASVDDILINMAEERRVILVHSIKPIYDMASYSFESARVYFVRHSKSAKHFPAVYIAGDTAGVLEYLKELKRAFSETYAYQKPITEAQIEELSMAATRLKLEVEMRLSFNYKE